MTDSIKLYNSNISIADDQSDLLPPCTHKRPQSFLNSSEYTRYILCCLTTTYHDNLVFYKIPASVKIYQGDPIYGSSQSFPKGKMHFHFNAEDASNEGFVHEFVFKKEIEVVAMDRVSNIKVLMGSALNDGDMEVFDALNENFQLVKSDDKSSIMRHTDPINDYKILNYLCSMGFDGFASKPINDVPGDIHLCFSEDFLSNGHYSKYNDSFVVNMSQLIHTQ